MILDEIIAADPELRELLKGKLQSEIAALKADEQKNLELAKNASLESVFRERRLAEELSSLSDAHVFHFFGKVDANNCALAIDELGSWSRKDPGCDITVVFNSPGGSVWEGLALYDFMRDLSKRGHRLTTKSIGMAASMGAVLLQAGDTRVISPHSYMLLHEITSGAIGKVSELEDSIKLTERLQDQLLSILARRASMNKTQIRRAWKRKDYWIDANEALNLGFVDKIEE